jgi:hypothetical protein
VLGMVGGRGRDGLRGLVPGPPSGLGGEAGGGRGGGREGGRGGGRGGVVVARGEMAVGEVGEGGRGRGRDRRRDRRRGGGSA